MVQYKTFSLGKSAANLGQQMLTNVRNVNHFFWISEHNITFKNERTDSR